jgi:hypothetical protein
MKAVSLFGIAYAQFLIRKEEFNGNRLFGILLRSKKLRRMYAVAVQLFSIRPSHKD